MVYVRSDHILFNCHPQFIILKKLIPWALEMAKINVAIIYSHCSAEKEKLHHYSNYYYYYYYY